MHPFALNDEEIKLVSGAGSFISTIGGTVSDPNTPIDPIVLIPTDPKPIEETTLALGEEGGWYPDPAV